MRILKKLFLSLIGLFLIAITALVIFLSVFNPNNYKKEISQALTQAIGHNTEIHGKIKWQYFPTLAINMNNVTVKDQRTLLARIKTLSGKLDVMPLLHKQIVIKSVTVKKAKLFVQIDENGQNNWQGRQKKKLKKKVNHQKKQDTAFLKQINVNQVNLVDADISVKKPNGQIQIKDLNFYASDIALNQYFPFSLNANISVTEPNVKLSSNFKTKGKLSYNLNKTGTKALKTSTNITFNKIKYNNVVIDKVVANLKLANNNLNLTIKKIKAYQGILSGSVKYQLESKKVVSAFNIKRFSVNQFLYDLNKTKILNGALYGQINLKTQAKDANQAVAKLNGNIVMTVKKGKINGIDIWSVVIWTKKLFNKTKSLKQWVGYAIKQIKNPPKFNKKSTPFTVLTSKAVIKNGVMTTNNLSLGSKRLRIKGKGDVNLVKKNLDFDVMVALLKQKNKKKKIPLLPVRVYGPLNKPKVRPDIKLIAKTLKKRVKKNSRTAYKKKLKEVASR